MPRPEVVVDHLLLGVADLNLGIDWVENLTGIRAAPGGSHPGAGTRNALLALGGRRYLEIIAPDPAQKTYSFPVDVRQLSHPRLVTWAVRMSDWHEVITAARKATLEPSGPQAGSRMRPDGNLLKWEVLRLQNTFGSAGIQPFPFFIKWAEDSAHPSADSPPGCELISFQIVHPRAGRLREDLGRFGIEAEVKRSEPAAIIAKLRTPKGDLELR